MFLFSAFVYLCSTLSRFPLSINLDYQGNKTLGTCCTWSSDTSRRISNTFILKNHQFCDEMNLPVEAFIGCLPCTSYSSHLTSTQNTQLVQILSLNNSINPKHISLNVSMQVRLFSLNPQCTCCTFCLYRVYPVEPVPPNHSAGTLNGTIEGGAIFPTLYFMAKSNFYTVQVVIIFHYYRVP